MGTQGGREGCRAANAQVRQVEWWCAARVPRALLPMSRPAERRQSCHEQRASALCARVTKRHRLPATMMYRARMVGD